MSRCHGCENELPEGAKFCNHCGLSQTDPILAVIPQLQKDIPVGNLDEEQIPITPHLSQDDDALSITKEKRIPTTPRISHDNDVLPTIKTEAVRRTKDNTIKNGNGTVSHAQAPSLRARFSRDTGPIYIGRVVSVDRKPFRRNLLLTRVGLYTTLAILTCLIIVIGFTLAYAIFHKTH